MRARWYAVAYACFMALLSVCAVLFCRWMHGRDKLPEAFSVCGGVFGFVTVVFAVSLACRAISFFMSVTEAGTVVLSADCVGHVGKRRGQACRVALCDSGFVVDVAGACHVYDYIDVSGLETYPFEMRFLAHGTRYRFVFSDKEAARRLQARFLSMAGEFASAV